MKKNIFFYLQFLFIAIAFSCNSKTISLSQDVEGEWGDSNDGEHHFTITKKGSTYVLHDHGERGNGIDYILKKKATDLLTDEGGFVTLAYRTEQEISEYRTEKAWFLSLGPDGSGDPNDGKSDPIILARQINGKFIED
jgi:hypothetical protein